MRNPIPVGMSGISYLPLYLLDRMGWLDLTHGGLFPRSIPIPIISPSLSAGSAPDAAAGERLMEEEGMEELEGEGWEGTLWSRLRGVLVRERDGIGRGWEVGMDGVMS